VSGGGRHNKGIMAVAGTMAVAAAATAGMAAVVGAVAETAENSGGGNGAVAEAGTVAAAAAVFFWGVRGNVRWCSPLRDVHGQRKGARARARGKDEFEPLRRTCGTPARRSATHLALARRAALRKGVWWRAGWASLNRARSWRHEPRSCPSVPQTAPRKRHSSVATCGATWLAHLRAPPPCQSPCGCPGDLPRGGWEL
jgi:hypothetical protein